ncbi:MULTISPECIES: hypothetical protein [Pontibacillus]|uniref:DUF4190 domain-containing protein n=1 Tax=Pontibacillus chungwhensis TaxID=265426 RepID=A0ABY8UY02_9BACI|nr:MULTISPECIES: hypothetical protein [Pontibacillus]MCD5325407.1 hypothetical protein [Pontibacillus sp. HN14]WIF98522.1 hypothetical protein QNI29_02310 [Pontibacillus chungwhensis]
MELRLKKGSSNETRFGMVSIILALIFLVFLNALVLTDRMILPGALFMPLPGIGIVFGLIGLIRLRKKFSYSVFGILLNGACYVILFLYFVASLSVYPIP